MILIRLSQTDLVPVRCPELCLWVLHLERQTSLLWIKMWSVNVVFTHERVGERSLPMQTFKRSVMHDSGL